MSAFVLIKDEANAEDKGKNRVRVRRGAGDAEPEKLPGARKRSTAPRKAETGGPNGGGFQGAGLARAAGQGLINGMRI